MSIRNRKEFMATAAIHIAAAMKNRAFLQSAHDSTIVTQAWDLARELANTMPEDVVENLKGNTGPR